MKRFIKFAAIPLAILSLCGFYYQAAPTLSAYFQTTNTNVVPKVVSSISGYNVYGPSNISDNGTQLLYNGTPIGSGSGTVTNFSSNSGSPLFSTTVATPTSTPALNFTISPAAANTVYGNQTTGSATPTMTTGWLVLRGTATTSTGTTAVAAITGVTTSSICVYSPGNLAASALGASYISAVAANSVTITFTTTATVSSVFDVHCTLN